MPCNRAPGAGQPISDQTFTNWSQDITLRPTSIFQPTSVDELVALVKQAESENLSLHAVGSGWSFNDNMSPPGFSSGLGVEVGFLVRTDLLNRILSNTMGATNSASTEDNSASDPVFLSMTGAAKQRKLVHVEAGIRLDDLHDQLEAMSFVNGIALPSGHGFALVTLGGSGGQSLAGAVSTSTHGGDMTIPPVPDMVQGIHLVAPGGAEFFIQRGGPSRIADAALLAQNLPCVAGRIISDNHVFNAVLVSLGRMGIIYSLVIEVRPQFALNEARIQDTWGHVSGSVLLGSSSTDANVISNLRANNRFLQVLVLPYPNADDTRTCFVTTRNEVPLNNLNPDPSPSDFFSFACQLQPLQKSAVIAGIIAAAWVAYYIVSYIPFVGEAALGVAYAVSAALSPLLVPSITLGDYLATIINVMSQFGLFNVATGVVDSMLSSQQSPHNVTDLSFKIMDTYNPQANCYKARSLEVAFNADDTGYIDYLNNDIFGLINSFSGQNMLFGGYISLRYCGGSGGLLAIEKFKNTVCIEMSALDGLSSDTTILTAFEQAAANRGAAIHWGQMNTRTCRDIEAVFANTIETWRQALVRLSANGKQTTFDNDFCQQRCLEPLGAKVKRNPDLSYLIPLLMS